MAGCWGQSADVAENSNSETQATFTDANEALAEGTRLFDENQIDAAIAAFKQAVELNPGLAEAHFKLGIAYALQETQMQRSGIPVPINIGPDGKTPKLNSELSFEHAVEAYKRWLKDNPDDDIGHFNLGRTYSKLLKDEEAEDEFKQAVKLKPDDTEYQTELGSVLIKLAKYHEALGPLRKAIELDGTNDRAIALLEDAEAGRQRVDYVGPKNTNSNSANANANANANSNSNSASNSAVTVNARPPVNGRPANVATPPPRNRIATPANRP